MLKGFDENGDLRNVKVSKNGEIYTIVNNSTASEEQKEIETTLYAGIMTVGIEVQTIGVTKKVTQISIANYSETANVSVNVDNKTYNVGSNIAIDLPINKDVGIVGLSSTEADVKVQYVIKGVE